MESPPNVPSPASGGGTGIVDCCGKAAVGDDGGVPCEEPASVRAVAGGGVVSEDFGLVVEERLSPAGRPASVFAASGAVVRFAGVGGGSDGIRRTSSDDCSRLSKMTSVRIAIPIAIATAFRLA